MSTTEVKHVMGYFLLVEDWIHEIIDEILFSVLRKSARNIFIAYLASADLILCVFNMPMTLALTLTKSWPFYSDSWVFCKSVLTFQVTKTRQNQRFNKVFEILYDTVLMHASGPQNGP